MNGERAGKPPQESRAWTSGRTQGSQARGQVRDRVMPGKGQDGRGGWDRDGDWRVGLEEGPAVGGAGWVLRSLPAPAVVPVKLPACAHRLSPVPDRDILASPWSPELGSRGARSVTATVLLRWSQPQGAADRAVGQEVRENPEGGKGWMGQTWGQGGRASTRAVHAHFQPTAPAGLHGFAGTGTVSASL